MEHRNRVTGTNLHSPARLAGYPQPASHGRRLRACRAQNPWCVPTVSSRRRTAATVRALAAGQAGVVSRRQARDAGLSASALTRRVAEGGWRVLHPGVYLVDNAPLTSMGRAWAAVLYAQSPGRPDDVPDAAIAGMAALWLAGAVDECPAVVEVAVPKERRVRSRAGVLVRRRVTLPLQPARQPPRLRLEDALLDAVHRCTQPSRVVGLVLTTGQRRLTTPERIRLTAKARAQLRWRSLVLDLCEGLDDGVHSPLERRYAAEVERRHGLPHGARNVREDAPTAGPWYRDVRYREQQLVVELDGRAAHPVEGAFRDRRRDNHAARLGETTLRYGWREVVSDPCGIAAEVAGVLALAGWTGQPRGCGPGCAVGAPGASVPTSTRPAGNSCPSSGSEVPPSPAARITAR